MDENTDTKANTLKLWFIVVAACLSIIIYIMVNEHIMDHKAKAQYVKENNL